MPRRGNCEWTEEDIGGNETPQRVASTSQPQTTAPQREKVKRGLRVSNDAEYTIPRKQSCGSGSGSSGTSGKNDWLKYVRIKPFPSNIPTAQKWQAWLDYRRKVNIQLEQCGDASQKSMAGLLYTSIGEELEQIISAKGMFPDETEVPDGYPHLTNLMTNLNDYFRGLSDDAVNYNEFSSMKQKVGEAARDFHTRVVRQAEVCDLKQADSMIRNQFIQGMRDREHAKRSFTDGTLLEEIIAAASRNESVHQPEPLAVLTDSSGEKQPMVVAAVSEQRGRRSGGADRGRYERYDSRRGQFGRTNNRKQGDGRPCSNCGNEVHRFGTCPAKSRECRDCGKQGHFARMCRQKSSAVAAVKDEESSQADKVQIFE